MQVKPKKLKTGNWIICPHSGLPEKVTFSRPGGRGKRHVRTAHHDHIFTNEALIELLDPNVVVDLIEFKNRKGTS